MIDIVICSVPGIFTQTPCLAPAALAACAKSAGFTAAGIDLNIEVINKINKSKNKAELEAFIKQQEINPVAETEIGDLIDYCVQRIIKANAKTVGLCLLTQDNQFFTLWLCYHLKFLAPEIKIVIGGSGIKNFIAESKIGFAELLRSRGLIDDYINGDGEYSIVEYLRGNLTYPGINSATWQPVVDLNQLPYPDFADYDFTQYAHRGIPICDSRGCVRACEFCDVIEHWKKYQYRTADNIFKEMLYQAELYDIRKFLFYNSLTNGNMKEFRRLLDLICEYNLNHPNQQMSWEGYFIVRSQQQHPEELWEKIKKSNGFLQLGIESVIEKVRISLGKNFTNLDIDYHLSMAEKYSVPVMLLLIIGYPTETKQDFEFTKSWFQQRKHYFKHPIRSVVLSLAAILPNTQLDKNQNKYGIIKGEIPTIWMTAATYVSTQDRVDHYTELARLVRSFGVIADAGNDSLEAVKKEMLL
jgi:hypothetical protein